MSERTKDAIVDFAAFSLGIDRVHCVLWRSFLVRNWCGSCGNPKFGFGALAATGRLSVSTFEPFNSPNNVIGRAGATKRLEERLLVFIQNRHCVTTRRTSVRPSNPSPSATLAEAAYSPRELVGN